MAELRYYQKEAVRAIYEAIKRGENPLLIMATGTGKTVVMAELLRLMVKNQKQNLLIAHRKELLNQAADKIYKHSGHLADIEQGKLYAESYNKIHLGSVASIKNTRLERFGKNFYDYILTDEAHRSPSKTYRNIYEYHDLAKRIGVTATADRRDGIGYEGIYDCVAYEYPLHKAIRDGYLVPIHGRTVTDFEMDLSNLRTVGGKYSEEDLENLVTEYLGPLSESIKTESENLMTLIFLPSVKSCEFMAESLNSIGIKAGFIHGGLNDADRAKVLYDFHVGNITHLAGCDILIEGYDEPGIEAVVMAYPTTSRGRYSQMVGRGTRLYKNKNKLLLIEFTYNSQKLKLVDKFSLFATAGFEEDVRNSAKKDGDLLANLEDAHEEYYNHTAILNRLVKRSPGKQFASFDPFEICKLDEFDLAGEFNVTGKWAEIPISTNQLKHLTPFNFNDVKKLSMGQASVLIGKLIDKEYYPMPGSITAGQSRLLKINGINPEGLNKTQANVMIKEVLKDRI